MSTSRKVLRILGYGFLLLVIWNIVLFLLSIVFHFDKEMSIGAGIAFDVIMPVVVYLFVRLIKPATLKEAFLYSISWTLFVFLIVLLITIGNGTTKAVFGHWLSYLNIVLMALSPLIGKAYKGR